MMRNQFTINEALTDYQMGTHSLGKALQYTSWSKGQISLSKEAQDVFQDNEDDETRHEGSAIGL
jgi:hypothetical protein